MPATKYFWIISFAGWIGFLEASYANVLYWLYNYGGVCSGNVYGLVVTIYGNASLWGMILAPMCIRKWGKKSRACCYEYYEYHIHSYDASVYLSDERLHHLGYYGLPLPQCVYGFVCAYFKPAIQADIRDYQHSIRAVRELTVCFGSCYNRYRYRTSYKCRSSRSIQERRYHNR